MKSLQGLGLPSIMSMEEFEAQVAWPGDRSSSSGGGGASAAQEPVIKEPPAPAPGTTKDEDELTPLEPSYFDVGSHMVQEEETTPNQTPQPSPALALIPKDVVPVAKPE